MRLLSRYLLRSLAAPFLFALGALTGLLLVSQVAKQFPSLVGKGLPAGVIAEVLVLSLPFIIALTLPMAILVAVLYGISQLASENEITAMRANGISVGQMLFPVLIAGIFLAFFNFVFIDQVLPRSNARLRNLTLDIARKKPTFRLEEQVINEMRPSQYSLRASRIESFSGRLRDVTIYDLSLPTARRIIYADSGLMALDESNTDVQLLLFDGVAHEYRADEEGVVRVTQFDRNVVRARNVTNELVLNETEFERGDREMTTCEMIDRAALSRAWASRAQAERELTTRADLRLLLRLVPDGAELPPEPQETSHCGAWQKVDSLLSKYIFPSIAEAQEPVVDDRARALDLSVETATASTIRQELTNVADVITARERHRSELRNANAFQVEIHKKFTISLASLNFVLIGIALALRFPRGGMGLVMGGTMVIIAFFYISLTAGEGLADRNFTTPIVAMWFPNVILAVVGLTGLAAVRRESGSTRGGDLADLKELIFGWMRLRRRRA